MVKCIDCGFLAVRDLRSRQLVEMEQGYRIKGESPQVIDFSPHFNIYDAPRCFVRAYDLREEIKKDTRRCSSQEKILPVINSDRDCKLFTEWQQGFTAKEHREMLDRKEWRDWQENQRKSDRRWRIIELVVLGVIAVIVAGGFTILGAFIERGSLFP